MDTLPPAVNRNFTSNLFDLHPGQTFGSATIQVECTVAASQESRQEINQICIWGVSSDLILNADAVSQTNLSLRVILFCRGVNVSVCFVKACFDYKPNDSDVD